MSFRAWEKHKEIFNVHIWLIIISFMNQFNNVFHFCGFSLEYWVSWTARSFSHLLCRLIECAGMRRRYSIILEKRENYSRNLIETGFRGSEYVRLQSYWWTNWTVIYDTRSLTSYFSKLLRVNDAKAHPIRNFEFVVNVRSHGISSRGWSSFIGRHLSLLQCLEHFVFSLSSKRQGFRTFKFISNS